MSCLYYIWTGVQLEDSGKYGIRIVQQIPKINSMYTDVEQNGFYPEATQDIFKNVQVDGKVHIEYNCKQTKWSDLNKTQKGYLTSLHERQNPSIGDTIFIQ